MAALLDGLDDAGATVGHPVPREAVLDEVEALLRAGLDRVAPATPPP